MFKDMFGNNVRVGDYIYSSYAPTYLMRVAGLDFNNEVAALKHVDWPARKYDTLYASLNDVSSMVVERRYRSAA